MGQAINFNSYLKDSIRRKNTVGVFRDINRDDIEDISDYGQTYLYNITSDTMNELTGSGFGSVFEGVWAICRVMYEPDYGDTLKRYTRHKSRGIMKTGLKQWTEWHGKMCD